MRGVLCPGSCWAASEGKSWSSPEGKADGVLDQRGGRKASEQPRAVFREVGVGQSRRIITTDSPWEEWPCPKGEQRVGQGEEVKASNKYLHSQNEI